eukprot:4212355-Pyramimonas_sp.AAC.1
MMPHMAFEPIPERAGTQAQQPAADVDTSGRQIPSHLRSLRHNRPACSATVPVAICARRTVSSRHYQTLRTAGTERGATCLQPAARLPAVLVVGSCEAER